MNAKTTSRYGFLLISLHWVMLLLIVAVYTCTELREFYPKGSAIRDALKSWHYVLGLTVFVLLWVRLLARLAGHVPPILPAPPRWQLRVAHGLAFAIYIFLIAMPLIGWLIVSGEGKTVSFFGLDLPHLIGENRVLAKQLEDVHELVGNLGYGLIGVHVLAALFHHYVQRDNTLKRMLPG